MNNSNINWTKNVIGYQCFVDSFAIGEKPIESKKGLYPDSVYGHPVKFLQWNEEFNQYCYGYSFYGGDLDGIKNAVKNYLADFGIDMLYLTPIFEAESNHKYDTVDYKKIDPQFGDLSIFQKLLETCHNKNIKVILDGVFNHTSYHHPWYLKALDGIEPYCNFYKKDETGHFLNWNGVESLPLLNHTPKEVSDYLYNSPESIVKYWLDQGADGWRLDVAERLGHDVIRNIKKSIQQTHPDKILYGEVIESYGKEWLGTALLDGAMNYVFLGNTVNFLTNKINGETLSYELEKMYNEYPKEQLYNSWNIISTHDTNRMIYEVDGNENLFKIAVTLQFTYPGIPMIYNGDELGILPGQKDKDHRQAVDWNRTDILKIKEKEPWKTVQPMDWQKVNQYSSFFFFYKHLIWLRKTYPVFIEGEFIPVFSDENILAYFRQLDEKFALIIINKGETQNISLEIPQDILKHAPVLRGVHGPINEIKLDHKTINITVYNQNSIILVN